METNTVFQVCGHPCSETPETLLGVQLCWIHVWLILPRNRRDSGDVMRCSCFLLLQEISPVNATYLSQIVVQSLLKPGSR